MSDVFGYLRDKKEAVNYFKRENKVVERFFSDKKALVDELYEDVQSRVGDYESLRVKRDEYEYFYKTFKDKQYAVHYRSDGESEEVLLDENKLAGDSESLVVAYVKVSDDHKFVGYGFNRDGTDTFKLVIKNVESDKVVLEVEDLASGFQWFTGNKFFITKHNKSLRPFQVYKYDLKGESELVFQEDDKRAFVYLDRSKDKSKLFVYSSTKESSEVHVYDGRLRVFSKREEGHEYYVDSWFDSFLVLSNKDDVEFDLFLVEEDSWKKIMSPRNGSLHDFAVFENYVVAVEQFGYKKVRVLNLKTFKEYDVSIDEEVYSLESADFHEFSSEFIILSYSTLIHPRKYFRYDLVTKEKKLLKEDSKPGYDPSLYGQKKILVGDVPVSLCYKKEFDDGDALLLQGYGSYGAVYSPGFRSSRVALLNHGVAFAIAHVRGGGELGQAWYKDGKFLKKKNTFKDFLSVSAYFKNTGYSNLCICGRSAGGLLIGVVLNERPDLFSAALAGVPFVDVVNTMLDPDIPLTTAEYEEWGDPNKSEFLEYMKSYSPYDNVSRQEYPALFITTGLNDTRVHYWEPAKWHAKLKEFSTGNNALLLHANLDSGHFGKTSRDESILEICKEYAFVVSHVR